MMTEQPWPGCYSAILKIRQTIHKCWYWENRLALGLHNSNKWKLYLFRYRCWCWQNNFVLNTCYSHNPRRPAGFCCSIKAVALQFKLFLLSKFHCCCRKFQWSASSKQRNAREKKLFKKKNSTCCLNKMIFASFPHYFRSLWSLIYAWKVQYMYFW